MTPATSVNDLKRAIRHYLTIYNEASEPFQWWKTADQIIASVGKTMGAIDFAHL